jgi:uncharacterized cupin superfamily protein
VNTIKPQLLSQSFNWSPLDIAQDKIISGHPNTCIDHRYSDATGQFHTGFWRSEPGSWTVQYTESEVCFLLEGQIELQTTDGQSFHYKAHDAFIIPSGFVGTWITHLSCKKIYCIFEAAPKG